MCPKKYLAILLIFFFSFSSLFAQDRNNEVKVFTVGVEDYENWLPYSQFKNGKYEGLGRDILDLFAQKKGYVFNYEVFPLKRRDRMFVNQQLDLSFPDNPGWVKDLKQGLEIKYAPVLKFIDGVMVLPENLGKGIEDLKTLGIPLGFTPYQYLKPIQEGKIQQFTYPNYDSLYHKVELKHIDGAYMNIDIAKYYMNKNLNRPLSLSFDPSLPHAKGYWHLASIKHPELIKEFTLFIQENYAEVDELKKKYGFKPD